MESLYIDRKDTVLDVSGAALVVRTPGGERPLSFPLRNLQRIVVAARTELSTTVLQACTREGVSLVVLNPRAADVHTVTLPWRHGHAARRVAQYAMLQSPHQLLAPSRALVAFKLASQRRTLQRLLLHHPGARRAITRATGRMETAQRGVPAVQELATLRGVEGAGAREYFSALSHCVPASLQFTGRNRRPPRDPVNAALSLSYALLHGEAVRALCGAGLDPMLGFYHELSYNRESLACDLVEAFRSRADYWVVRLFNLQVLRMDHFGFSHEQRVDGACLMSKSGREQFYPAWDTEARRWRRGMRRIAAQWGKSVLALDRAAGVTDDRSDNAGH